jgi:hypothetical protein
MKEQIEMVIASPPDREHLVIELWLGDTYLGEVNREDGTIRFEVDGGVNNPGWKVSVDELIRCIQLARDEIKTHGP